MGEAWLSLPGGGEAEGAAQPQRGCCVTLASNCSFLSLFPLLCNRRGSGWGGAKGYESSSGDPKPCGVSLHLQALKKTGSYWSLWATVSATFPKPRTFLPCHCLAP